MQHLQPNTTLQGGKYRIERVLGQGGFGITYLVHNTTLGVDVAIKEFFMKDENGRDGSSVSILNTTKQELFVGQKEKFKKEARRMFSIKNEHIVGVHDLFEENGTAYYVMDYVDGENLAERLNRTGQPLTENEVREFLPQILDALAMVHDAAIWHLDLKPANIMVDKSGNVKLIDFGASKQFKKGGATTDTLISYTIGYAPREQMEQNYDKFGPWTDLYALGATLYNLLTNRHPPLPTDIDDDMSEDKNLALPFPSGISDAMKELVLLLMHTNRMQRPQNISEVQPLLETLSAKVEKPSEVPVPKSEPEKVADEKDQEIEETLIAPLRNKDVCIEQSINSYLDDNEFKGLTSEKIYQEAKILESKSQKEKAFKYFLKSAEMGFSRAQLKVAHSFAKGDGIPQDIPAALDWYQKAADNGESVALNYMALCYNKKGRIDTNANEAKVPQNEEIEETLIAPLHKRKSHNENMPENKGKRHAIPVKPYGISPKKKNDETDFLIAFGVTFIVFAILTVIVLVFVVLAGIWGYNSYSLSSSPVEYVEKELIKEVSRMQYETAIGGCKYYGPVDNNNKPNGKGEAYFDDGRYYKGNFDHGTLAGDNCYFTYPDGSKYEGNFKNGLFHGHGTFYWADGDKYEGEFKEGARIKGTYTWPEKRKGYMYKYEGEFKNNNFDGNGTAYYVGGGIKSGIWKNGKLVQSTKEKSFNWTGSYSAIKDAGGTYGGTPVIFEVSFTLKAVNENKYVGEMNISGFQTYFATAKIEGTVYRNRIRIFYVSSRGDETDEWSSVCDSQTPLLSMVYSNGRIESEWYASLCESEVINQNTPVEKEH